MPLFRVLMPVALLVLMPLALLIMGGIGFMVAWLAMTALAALDGFLDFAPALALAVMVVVPLLRRAWRASLPKGDQQRSLR